jgi:hypothetical protein
VKLVRWLLVLMCMAGLAACSTPAGKVKKLRLGMAPDEVRKAMGEPFAVRASKVFADGQTTEVWEYLPGFSLNPKDYWVFFENGKVVQWGEPGDFSGKSSGSSVEPYKPTREER